MSRNNNRNTTFPLLLLVLFSIVISSMGFAPIANLQKTNIMAPLRESAAGGGGGGDPSDIIAKKITVTGDVDGGYFRSCVKNEGGRFRKLIGTMSPPDGSSKAEIVVEGKRKMVDGFIRWCKKGDVGLSQKVTVESITDEEPTGLFDDFYVPTGR